MSDSDGGGSSRHRQILISVCGVSPDFEAGL
jgi:hypothetical protein